MKTRILIVLAIALGLANPITAVMTTAEHVSGSAPGMLIAFAVPWLVGAALVRFGRVTLGAVLIGLLALFEAVSYPGWKKTSALDWAWQSVVAVAAVGCVVVAVAVLLERHRAPARRVATAVPQASAERR